MLDVCVRVTSERGYCIKTGNKNGEESNDNDEHIHLLHQMHRQSTHKFISFIIMHSFDFTIQSTSQNMSHLNSALSNIFVH
jgi:hypothetical protein